MITPEKVKYIASLARIHLREEEVARLTVNLEDILHYIAKLEKLDIAGVEPTSHVLPLANVFRPDVLRPSLSQSAAMSLTTASQDGSFKVPLVIE